MSKFSVGDSVVVYGTYESTPYRQVGVISKIARMPLKPPADTEYFEVDFGDGGYVVHPKQCRKLVKKPKSRFWIDPNPVYSTSYMTPLQTTPLRYISTAPHEGWIEVVEVKKK